MKNPLISHPWDVSPKEAVEIQKRLRQFLHLKWDHPNVSRVGGIDVSYARESKYGYAVVVVLTWPSLEELDIAWAREEISFPYIPGLLTFREAPLLLQAWGKLQHYPDLIYVDGQGIAHPRSMGLAAHLGVLLQVPTIGCAKTPLVGGEPPVGNRRGDYAPLIYKGKKVGVALRTREGVRPLYVSPGHRIDLEASIHWVLQACRGYRVPEPLRRAHIKANRIRSTINP
ncbi:MAG: deoxyribonuclease V [Deltaproteobacteria bacterium]|nr:MAG: deoxyribonuclease V [Deltaproteobacteria bacterium]